MIVTSAGRFKKNTSQGWPSSSARRTRPIRMPIATPRVMAMTKLAATRRSVMARLKGSSPVTVSAAIFASTAAGDGIRRGLAASSAAICHKASSDSSDNNGKMIRRSEPPSAAGEPVATGVSATARLRAIRLNR